MRAVDRVGSKGTVRIRAHHVDDIRPRISAWDSLDRMNKMLALRHVMPVHDETASNTTTNSLARHITDKLMGQVVPNATHYAIGTGTTTPAVTDTDLAVRAHTQILTLLTDGGLTLDTSTFWDLDEANGITFREGGLLAGGTPGTPGSGGVLLARVVFPSPQTKTNSLTFTVEHAVTWIPK